MSNEHDIEKRFNNLNEVVSITQEKRNLLINKMFEAVEKTELNPGGEPATVTEAKLGAIKTAAELLKDKEDASMKQIKLELGNKQLDATEAQGKIVTEVLKSVNLANNIIPSADKATITELGTLEVDEDEHPITEGELEINEAPLSD